MSTVKRTWTQGDRIKLIGNGFNEDNGNVIDGTSSSIEIIYWFKGKPAVKAGGTIDTANPLQFSYTFTTGIPGYGWLMWTWRFTDSAGKIWESNQVFEKEVRRRIAA